VGDELLQRLRAVEDAHGRVSDDIDGAMRGEKNVAFGLRRGVETEFLLVEDAFGGEFGVAQQIKMYGGGFFA
jgi:hypothetical protein